MKAAEQKAAAKAFAEYWKGKGYEKGESQPFWLSLLRDVYGVEHPEQYIIFEDQVHLDHTSFIDGFIPSTHVLIEQKGQNKDLRKPIKQARWLATQSVSAGEALCCGVALFTKTSLDCYEQFYGISCL